MPLVIDSPIFHDGEDIPQRHTGEAGDVSPPLVWTGQPEGTQTLVLIVDDPDAPDPARPKMVWDHWILFNIPGDSRGLGEDMTSDRLPPGVGEGLNSWGQMGYRGPCPRIGRHRYFFRLYALDIRLPSELGQPRKDDLLLAMEDHILAHAELVGLCDAGASAAPKSTNR